MIFWVSAGFAARVPRYATSRRAGPVDFEALINGCPRGNGTLLLLLATKLRRILLRALTKKRRLHVHGTLRKHSTESYTNKIRVSQSFVTIWSAYYSEWVMKVVIFNIGLSRTTWGITNSKSNHLMIYCSYLYYLNVYFLFVYIIYLFVYLFILFIYFMIYYLLQVLVSYLFYRVATLGGDEDMKVTGIWQSVKRVQDFKVIWRVDRRTRNRNITRVFRHSMKSLIKTLTWISYFISTSRLIIEVILLYMLLISHCRKFGIFKIIKSSNFLDPKIKKAINLFFIS